MKANRVQVERVDDIAQIVVRILVVLLVLAAVIWVLIDQSVWPVCLVLVGAALSLAILGDGR